MHKTILLLLLFCGTYFQLVAQESPWKIYWDSTLIKGRYAYINDTNTTNTKSTKPNIILIVADDLGQTDISLYGNTQVNTPHIDAIGKQGIKFTEAYISSPVCSPSRAGLLTGRYQQRFGHELQPCEAYVKNKFQEWGISTFNILQPLTPVRNKEIPSDEDRMRQGLPPSEITIAEVLRKNGYATAIIGKWHLGAMDFALPCQRGFDYQYGFSEAYTLYANPKEKFIVNQKIKGQFMDLHQWRNAKGRQGNCAITKNCCTEVEARGYLSDRLTDEAISFMQNHDSTKPFFIYLPYNAPHAPFQVPQHYYNMFSHVDDPVKRIYYAMIKNLDDQIGRIHQYLEEQSIDSNTLIIFLSDNGGARYNGSTDNSPYRGGKLTQFEGGLKIPMMIQWKGQIGEGIYENPVISLDIFTTICALTKCRLPSDRVYDGIDLTQTLSNKTDRALYWRSAENSAIRFENWKLILNDINHTKELYNLHDNPDESVNVIASRPDIAVKLERLLDSWHKTMGRPLWPRTVNYLYKDKMGVYYFAF